MQYFSSSANFLAFVLIMFFSMRFPGVKVSRMIFYVWKAYFVHIKRLYSLDLWLHYNHFEILVFSLSTKGFQNSTQYSSIYIINKDKIIFLILHTTSHFIQAWIIIFHNAYLYFHFDEWNLTQALKVTAPKYKICKNNNFLIVVPSLDIGFANFFASRKWFKNLDSKFWQATKY